MNSVIGNPWYAPAVNLYLSRPHPCGYLPDRSAATLFVDPAATMHDELYAFLLERGFRRSGGHVYCHYCPGCRACQAVRIPVHAFQLSRSWRRIWQRNQDLTVRVLPAGFNNERFALYQDYIGQRHGDGPMANPLPDDFTDYLLASWSMTRFVEFRAGGRLLMVAVTDLLPGALSAVYTFFTPEEAARSLGSYAILWQIRETIGLGGEHLYLGYWIAGCRKMLYKSRFQPLECFRGRQWLPFQAERDRERGAAWEGGEP
ncbi:arginyltransferase [Candidatus Magnetaquicoccus inordinatus]|uniref:arginyltransferase n=1 Tax=Candidatus Magnetaquicoccus inordinatus TaxID=2496818 RepID=UPI00102B5630|nr:arginyltransferase [Candidatus Magnetaquicoccus inordinatus]